jgi:hypothetical protein
MIRAFLLIIPVMILLTLAACSKTCYCKPALLNLNYVSFTPAETDTVILRRYDRNSNFNQLLDTFVLTTQTADFNYNKDTLSIHAKDEASRLRSFYNYVLYLPSLNRSDSLSGINELYDREKGNSNLECTCTNRILSFYQNRDTITTLDPVSPYAYINR